MGKELLDVRVARVYFEKRNPDYVSALLDEPEYEFGGWRKDDVGEYLRVIIIGNLSDNELARNILRYGVKRVTLEPPWPEIPVKVEFDPLPTEEIRL